jgi:hypothetical protein
MKFNLREKLHQAREGATATIAIGVLKADQAAQDAIEKLGKLGDSARTKANEIGAAATQTAQQVRTNVETNVDRAKEAARQKTQAVKNKTVQTLGQIGEKIEQTTADAAKATKKFGKQTRAKLDFTKNAEKPAAPQKKPAAMKAKKITPNKKAPKR